MDCLSALMEKSIADVLPAVVIATLELMSALLMRREKKDFSEEWETAFISLLLKIMGRLSPG